jgi:hypothetical protein
VIGLPPSLAGAVHDSVAERSPAAPDTPLGAPGAVAAAVDVTATSSKSTAVTLSFHSCRMRNVSVRVKSPLTVHAGWDWPLIEICAVPSPSPVADLDFEPGVQRRRVGAREDFNTAALRYGKKYSPRREPSYMTVHILPRLNWSRASARVCSPAAALTRTQKRVEVSTIDVANRLLISEYWLVALVKRAPKAPPRAPAALTDTDPVPLDPVHAANEPDSNPSANTSRRRRGSREREQDQPMHAATRRFTVVRLLDVPRSRPCFRSAGEGRRRCGRSRRDYQDFCLSGPWTTVSSVGLRRARAGASRRGLVA